MLTLIGQSPLVLTVKRRTTSVCMTLRTCLGKKAQPATGPCAENAMPSVMKGVDSEISIQRTIDSPLDGRNRIEVSSSYKGSAIPDEESRRLTSNGCDRSVEFQTAFSLSRVLLNPRVNSRSFSPSQTTREGRLPAGPCPVYLKKVYIDWSA